jgi:hypothetical protein
MADGDWVGELSAGRVPEFGKWSASSFTAADRGERWRYGKWLELWRRVLTTQCGVCHRGYPPETYRSSEWAWIVDEMAERSKLRERKRETMMSYLVAAERVWNSWVARWRGLGDWSPKYWRRRWGCFVGGEIGGGKGCGLVIVKNYQWRIRKGAVARKVV